MSLPPGAIVVGAHANGLGVVRSLAARGIRTAIVSTRPSTWRSIRAGSASATRCSTQIRVEHLVDRDVDVRLRQASGSDDAGDLIGKQGGRHGHSPPQPPGPKRRDVIGRERQRPKRARLAGDARETRERSGLRDHER